MLVFLLYGGIQGYVAAKLIHALQPAGGVRALIAIAALLMTFGPLILWRLERCAECHLVAVAGAWLVYGWMGFSFLFFWFGLALDAYRVVAAPMGWSGFGAKSAFVVPAVVAAGVWLYGFFAARHPQVERLVIRSAKLAPGSAGLRIVQISDVHLGILVGRNRLAAILQQVAALQQRVFEVEPVPGQRPRRQPG